MQVHMKKLTLINNNLNKMLSVKPQTGTENAW